MRCECREPVWDCGDRARAFGRSRGLGLPGRSVVDSGRAALAPAALAGQSWRYDLVIGYGFMRDYIMTFDYPARKIVLEAAR